MGVNAPAFERKQKPCRGTPSREQTDAVSDKRDRSCHLFVYGTLMPGYGNYARIAQHVHESMSGETRGELVDLGAFPALVPGDGIVRGSLLRIDHSALAVTDCIEGAHADRSRAMYMRRRAQVAVEGGETIEAWTYEWAKPATIAHRLRLVIGHIGGAVIHAWNPCA